MRQKGVLLSAVPAMISSTNNTVRWPSAASWRRANSMTSRRSATPDNTAEIDLNTAADWSATSRASVVLPLPGGPQRIIECGV